MSGAVTTNKRDGVGWLVFDHEARRNALTADMWRAIPEAVAGFEADPEVRVVVMRGAGETAFVSGADISEFKSNRVGDAAMEYDAVNGRAFDALSSCTKPLVAMIHGFCVGGGCALALCADLRISAADGVFAIPAARLGLGYSASGLATLVRVVGDANARDLFLTARRVAADEALRMGLVHRVVTKEALANEVASLAATLAENAPLTLRAAKLALRDQALPEARRSPDGVHEAIRACYASADYREGIQSFLDKRRPQFSGE